MALTISNVIQSATQNRRLVTFQMAFDSSYPTGGEELLPGKLRMSRIDFALFETRSGYLLEYDYSNSKVKVFTPGAAGTGTLNIKDADGAAAAGVALYFDEDGTAGERVQFVSPTNTDGSDANVTIAASAGAQVADTTDLSGLTGVRAMFLGY